MRKVYVSSIFTGEEKQVHENYVSNWLSKILGDDIEIYLPKHDLDSDRENLLSADLLVVIFPDEIMTADMAREISAAYNTKIRIVGVCIDSPNYEAKEVPLLDSILAGLKKGPIAFLTSLINYHTDSIVYITETLRFVEAIKVIRRRGEVAYETEELIEALEKTRLEV